MLSATVPVPASPPRYQCQPPEVEGYFSREVFSCTSPNIACARGLIPTERCSHDGRPHDMRNQKVARRMGVKHALALALALFLSLTALSSAADAAKWGNEHGKKAPTGSSSLSL